MSQKDALLEELKRHVATGAPVEADLSALVAADAAPLVSALFALAPDEAVGGQWARGVDFERADAMGKIAWVFSEADEVEERVDAMLDGGEAQTVVEALARAGVAWDHPAIAGLLDHDGSRRAAALVLATADPDAVDDWLADCDVLEDALDGLRAAALCLETDLDTAFAEWAQALEDLDDVGAERARLDGLYAVLDPEEYARRVLAGDSGIGWLADPPVVADFLQVHGPTSWLDVLAVLEAVEDPGVEFVSLLAASAAAGVGYDEPSEAEARQLLELLTVEPGAAVDKWEPLATHLGLGFGVAVAPDDELALLAVQVAAHERLLAFDFASPGVPGLPLSATAEDALDLDASGAMLDSIAELGELPEASTAAVVRTLCDLRRLLDHDPERFADHAEAWVSAFLDSRSRAVRLSARQLVVVLDREAAEREADRLDGISDIEAALAVNTHSELSAHAVASLQEHARLEGPLGLECARRLALIGTDEALAALAGLWASATVFRAAFYRDCLEEGVVSH